MLSAVADWLISQRAFFRAFVVQGMRQGIEDSAAFILFLSEGVLMRPFCQVGKCVRASVCAPHPSISLLLQFEIRQALALKKPMVLLHGACEQEINMSCARIT